MGNCFDVDEDVGVSQTAMNAVGADNNEINDATLDFCLGSQA